MATFKKMVVVLSTFIIVAALDCYARNEDSFQDRLRFGSRRSLRRAYDSYQKVTQAEHVPMFDVPVISEGKLLNVEMDGEVLVRRKKLRSNKFGGRVTEMINMEPKVDLNLGGRLRKSDKKMFGLRTKLGRKHSGLLGREGFRLRKKSTGLFGTGGLKLGGERPRFRNRKIFFQKKRIFGDRKSGGGLLNKLSFPRSLGEVGVLGGTRIAKKGSKQFTIMKPSFRRKRFAKGLKRLEGGKLLRGGFGLKRRSGLKMGGLRKGLKFDRVRLGGIGGLGRRRMKRKTRSGLFKRRVDVNGVVDSVTAGIELLMGDNNVEGDEQNVQYYTVPRRTMAHEIVENIQDDSRHNDSLHGRKNVGLAKIQNGKGKFRRMPKRFRKRGGRKFDGKLSRLNGMIDGKVDRVDRIIDWKVNRLGNVIDGKMEKLYGKRLFGKGRAGLRSKMGKVEGIVDGKIMKIDGKLQRLNESFGSKGRYSKMSKSKGSMVGNNKGGMLDGSIIDGKMAKLDGKLAIVDGKLAKLKGRTGNSPGLMGKFDGKAKVWRRFDLFKKEQKRMFNQLNKLDKGKKRFDRPGSFFKVKRFQNIAFPSRKHKLFKKKLLSYIPYRQVFPTTTTTSIPTSTTIAVTKRTTSSTTTSTTISPTTSSTTTSSNISSTTSTTTTTTSTTTTTTSTTSPTTAYASRKSSATTTTTTSSPVKITSTISAVAPTTGITNLANAVRSDGVLRVEAVMKVAEHSPFGGELLKAMESIV